LKDLKKALFVSLMIFFSGVSYAQFDNLYYTKEITYGLNFNTNSGFIGGFDFRYSKYIKSNQFQSFTAEIVNVKHPKELKYLTSYSGSFIRDKQIYLFPLRLSYGREILFFRKSAEEGMQMYAHFSLGPTLGLIKPYYIIYDYQDDRGVVNEPYDPAKHTDPNNIQDRGGFFRGFNQLSVEPGFHLRGSIGFEFGKMASHVAGIEIGALLEAYAEPIDIIPTAPNKSVFASGYLILYYGKRK
jgi:hypothetical protein